MIKYTICPDQEKRYTTIEEFEDWKEYVEKAFKLIEEDGLEGKLYQVQPGHRTVLFSSMFNEDTMFYIHFICTNVNTGYFSAGYEAFNPSPMCFYIDLPEFVFE